MIYSYASSEYGKGKTNLEP